MYLWSIPCLGHKDNCCGLLWIVDGQGQGKCISILKPHSRKSFNSSFSFVMTMRVENWIGSRNSQLRVNSNSKFYCISYLLYLLRWLAFGSQESGHQVKDATWPRKIHNEGRLRLDSIFLENHNISISISI